MTARPRIDEWIPKDRTGYHEFDEASYINNKNRRPISPYTRKRRLTSCIWYKAPYSSTRSYYSACGPSLKDNVIKQSLIARCKVKNLDTLDMIMLTRDLKEAVQGTTSFMLKVPRTISLLKRGRFVEAARNQGWSGRRSIPNTYLAYTYAVSPLVHDCARLWEFATHPKPPVFQTVKTARKTLSMVRSTNLTSYVAQPLRAVYEEQITHSVRVVRCFSTDAFLDLEGLDLNPIPTIWDAIPYSFIVDWFVPIGDSLKMISYTGIKPINGYNCYRVVNEHRLTFPNGVVSRSPNNPLLFWEYGTGLPKSESFYFERTIDNTLTWTLPEAAAAFKNSMHLSLRRLLNASMMAWQAVIK